VLALDLGIGLIQCIGLGHGVRLGLCHCLRCPVLVLAWSWFWSWSLSWSWSWSCHLFCPGSWSLASSWSWSSFNVGLCLGLVFVLVLPVRLGLTPTPC